MDGKCLLCHITGPLVEAHIIPRPFFSIHGSAEHPARVLSNSPGVHPKRSPTGFYDRYILCERCDRAIGVWDQYGVEVFIYELEQFKPLGPAAHVTAFFRAEYDYNRLKLFLLSVLWRAGVSSREEFERVHLGPHADDIRRMMLAGSAGPAQQYSAVLSVFTINNALPDFAIPIMDPFHERWHGINGYRLSFGLFTVYIKVDNRPLPETLEQVMLRPGQPLGVVARDYVQSSEASVSRSIAREPQNRRLFKPPGSE